MKWIIAVSSLLCIALCNPVACQDSVTDSKDSAGKSQMLDGLWSGSWGGGERDGVIFQPVVAEMFIRGTHIELVGFRNADRLTGTVRFDAGAKKMHITPAAEKDGEPAPKSMQFAYEIKGDNVTLTDTHKIEVVLKRHRTQQRPLANVQVELVAADGINDAGDLLVTEFTAIEAGRERAASFAPTSRTLHTKQGTVLLIEEAGPKKMTLDEARKLIRPSTPVAVAYRPDDRPAPHQFHQLWKDTGPAPPDSEAAVQTLTRLLRPGTLVFVLSARENVPVP